MANMSVTDLRCWVCGQVEVDDASTGWLVGWYFLHGFSRESAAMPGCQAWQTADAVQM